MFTPQPDSPIQFTKGVGPKRAEMFEAAGLKTVGDLLDYFPYRYESQQGDREIADLEPGSFATIHGQVVRVRNQPPMRFCEIHDGSESIWLRWFNPTPDASRIRVGQMISASGPVSVYNGRLDMVQPRIAFGPNTRGPAAENAPVGQASLPGERPVGQAPLPAPRPSQRAGTPAPLSSSECARGARLIGVYRASGELKPFMIRQVVQNLLLLPTLPVEQVVPAALVRRRNLLPREAAIRQMHAPQSNADKEAARRTLAYEELLLMELAVALRRRRLLMAQRGLVLRTTPEIDQRIRARFPFALTDSQTSVIRDISRDLSSGRPMTRLLQGDVGCGKTVVALHACLVAIANGFQAAIMAPTEILAEQHFNNIEKYLAGSRVRRSLLRGGQTRARRAELLGAIERGETDLVVGTQALIQKDVGFHKLGLVVIDEQHKFGVLQRHTIRTKGPMPHYLVMTATPIPRTLAMTVFGDLDVSIIHHSPPGRGRIITKLVSDAKWATVMGFVAQRLNAGEQAYVVCPQIGADLAGDEPVAAKRVAVNKETGEVVRTARQTYEQLTSGPWKDLRIALLHGGLPAAERQRVLGEFAAGTLHAVVATTVVEVGIDVPNATIMVVENADRFGLSQLHQLRGRVGRGRRDSLCVLISHDAGAKAEQRLAIMGQTTDGFRIAEVDLQQRGPGELFGTRQHGLPQLRVANVLGDFGLLEHARDDAFALIDSDPELKRPEHARMIPALERLFGKKLALIDAA